MYAVVKGNTNNTAGVEIVPTEMYLTPIFGTECDSS